MGGGKREATDQAMLASDSFPHPLKIHRLSDLIACHRPPCLKAAKYRFVTSVELNFKTFSRIEPAKQDELKCRSLSIFYPFIISVPTNIFKF